MIYRIKQNIQIFSASCIGGRAEHEGPLGDRLDHHDNSEKFECKTWEQAESEMQRLALEKALAKAKLSDTDISVLLAGDLMNQCTSSGYGLVGYDIPFVGLYGACSTAAESMGLAAIMSDTQGILSAAVTSSHFCSAERQFRFPLEYGGQRTPTSQRTVTGAAAFLIGSAGSGARICDVMFGRSVDSTITDINNMGAAMAPAATDTLCRYFQESATKPNDYDMIYTGDLGREGAEITRELLSKRGYTLGKNYDDCGMLIYNCEIQDMHAGGSGCGCSAVVAAAKILPMLMSGELKNVLFIGTGALMSPSCLQQGLSIPSIAHLVHLTSPK